MINSAIVRQEAHLRLRLVSRSWNEVLGAARHFAVRNITKTIRLTKSLADRPEEIRTMVLCVRDTSKGRLESCRRGEVVAALLAKCPFLLE